MTDRLTPDAVYRLADRHQRLRSRRYELLPLTGDGAAFTDVQGRGWGKDATTSPADLADLVSSIAVVGQLQPILVEDLPDGERRVVSGERRLRAMKWGSIHHPGNGHFAAIASVLVDGPLSDEERRSWQLIENLARTDLQPGELAAALLYERCAMMVSRLLANGTPVAESIATLDDPLARFEALDRLRCDRGLHRVGAPWREVIERIGIQLSEERAKRLVQAFRSLPADLSSEMDAAEISLHSRMEFLKLHRGRAEAASEIWAALQERGEPQRLLTRSVIEALEHPDADAGEVVDAAEAFHEAANTARAETNRGSDGPPLEDGDARLAAQSEIAEEITAPVRASLASLLTQLRKGATLKRYDYGSLRLQLDELADHLRLEPFSPAPVQGPLAVADHSASAV